VYPGLAVFSWGSGVFLVFSTSVRVDRHLQNLQPGRLSEGWFRGSCRPFGVIFQGWEKSSACGFEAPGAIFFRDWHRVGSASEGVLTRCEVGG